MEWNLKTIRILLSTLFLLLYPAVFAEGHQEDVTILSTGTHSGERIELNFLPGPEYSMLMNKVLYKYTVYPQVALWLETEEGQFVGTIYVTRAVAEQNFSFAPGKGRPEALPVWSHLAKSETLDGISAATVENEESHVYYGKALSDNLEPGNYIIQLEINRSYDWNDVYTKKNSGVNGQPSVLYRTEVTIGDTVQSLELKPYGRGSVDGSNGEITPGLEGIDTALNLFSLLEVQYYPQ